MELLSEHVGRSCTKGPVALLGAGLGGGASRDTCWFAPVTKWGGQFGRKLLLI